MKERPILMSGSMVRAIIEGRKTQTRRLAKHPLAMAAKRIHSYHGQTEFDCVLADETGGIIHCPYGVPGDRLWVRETWCAWDTNDEEQEANEVAGNVAHLVEIGIGRWHITYRADPRRHAEKWRPSIFMPRWASRITLEIESVRVERLQDISEEDALAEGCNGDCPVGHIPSHTESPCVYHYAQLWESINGPGSWDVNLWVWVIQFRRIQ